jgi:Zn finger protein HypA/HybF involved in hydrogenase expression
MILRFFMCDSVEKVNSVERKYRHVHCPNCGSTDVKLAGGKGKFIGSVGGMIVRHTCKSCNSGFTMIVTGDEMFPDRGYGFIKEDMNVLLGKTA